MAGNIKGITIEFRGDTTKLDKALRDVNKETRDIDKELKAVNNSLKFNPKNVDMLKQKYQLVGDKIKQTKDKLDLLKQAQAKMDADGVDKNTAEYRELQREILKAENQLKNLTSEQKKLAAQSSKLGQFSAQMKGVGDKLTKAGEAMKGVSLAGAAVVGTLGTMALKAGKAADDINTLSKVYGIGTAELQKYKLAADLTDVSVETIAKTHQKLEKNMYAAANGSKSQVEAFDTLGVSVTDADGNLRDSEDVWNDVIAKLGEMDNEAERNALAQKLMGKSAAELNPIIEDGGETYKKTADIMKQYGLDVVDQETLDKANEFNDTLDTIKLIGGAALSEVSAELAGVLAPALEKVADFIGKIAGWLTDLDPEVLAIIGVIAGVIAVIAPLLLVLGKIAFAISSISGLMATLGVSFAAIAGPIGIAIAAIAAIIAIGVLLYKNWDKIKAKAAEIKQKIAGEFGILKNKISTIFGNIVTTAKNKFQALKDAALKPVQTLRDKIKGIVDKIKGFFNFTFKTPKLKKPYFKITPAGWKIGDLLQGKIPHLEVGWHAKGGIFRKPTLLTGGGGLHGVGDGGAEAILPLDELWRHLDNMGGIVINVYGGSQSAKEIAEAVRKELISAQNRRRLAWQ